MRLLHSFPLVHRVFLPAALIASVVPVIAQDLAHRQADITVTVRAADGTPVGNADILLEMANPAFRFGTSVSGAFVNSGFNAQTFYAQKHFNSLTYGNDLKWDAFEWRPSPEASVPFVRKTYRLRSFDGSDPVRMRGHVTVWSQQAPNDVRNATAEDAEWLRQRIHTHIETYHTTLRGVIENFDLYNEGTNARELIEKLFPSSKFSYGNMNGGGVSQAEIDEIAEWFRIAQDADPDARLFINEYNIMNDWDANGDSRVRTYKSFIDRLRDAGAPIGGIGVQAHIDRVITYEQFARRFAILAEPMAPTANHPEGLPGLPIEVTELDIGINVGGAPGAPGRDATQAKIVEDILRAAFENPAVEGVTVWGINNGAHWRGNAVMYDDSNPNGWILKPSGQVWVDLVQGEWWNQDEGTTDADGRFSTTVFKGTQRVRVVQNDQVYWASFEAMESGDFEVTLPDPAAPVTSFWQWRDLQPWEDYTDGMPEADPDGDGIVNLVEFLAGTDPVDEFSSPVMDAEATADTISLRFKVRKSMADDILTTVRYSRAQHRTMPALSNWSPVVPSVAPVLVEEGEDYDTYEITVSRPDEARFYGIEFEDASYLNP